MSAKTPFEVGQVVDQRYELRRIIGGGAEGIVYEAFHRFLHRTVAIKASVAEGNEASIQRRRRRMLREAHVLSELRHPGIVSVLDAGITTDGKTYVAMELLEGKTLDALVSARGKLAVTDAIAIGVELADTLAFAHKRGVLHRDIKPSNVFVVRQPSGGERTKLLDFGTSKAAPIVDVKLTEEGSIVGTPAYMSPEQLMAVADLDARVDVYSLGALLYECLAGRCVYSGNYAAVVRAAYSPDPIPSLGIPGIDPGLEWVVAKALAKDRSKRFQSMKELGDALKPYASAEGGIKLLDVQAGPGRRRHERAPFLAPVSLRGPDGVVDGRCEDISESGMLFLSRDECAAQRIYELRFGAPVSGRVAICRARAQWVRPRPAGGWAVGLEFIEPSADLISDIAMFVRLMKQPSLVEPEPESSVVRSLNPPVPSNKPTVLDAPMSRRR